MQVLHSLSLSLSLVLALLVVISTPIQASLLDSLAPYSTILLSPLSWLEYMTTVSVAAPHQPVDPDHRTVTHSHQQSQPYIWPLPHTYTEGSDRTYIAPPRRGHSFVKYIVKDASDVPTPLSGLDCHVRDRVQGMLSRYGTIQQPLQVHSSYQTVDSVTLSTLDLNEGMIVGLDVRVVDQHAKLTHGVNESYSLHIPAPTKSHAETATILKVTVDAQTIYGVIHALETLSQLVRYDYDRELYYFDHTPLTVIDKPRFPYRGLLIDTSRHFLPLPTMFEILVSMMINKLNVLHWHIVDSQAFPFRSTTHPNITQYGRYTIREQYTYTDIEQIVQFANQVGIRVVFELDVPGHAASWCAGEPQLCPSTTCLEPLDISQTYTFKVIEDLLRELTALSNDTYVHLGADEVDTHCWSDTPRLADWFKTHNMSMLDGYAYSLGKLPC